MRENLISKQHKNASFKGITLIALVVTIIVLLILAGVTIMTLFGENGLINTAEKAKKETQNSQANEIAGIGSLGNQMNSVLNEEVYYSIAGVTPSPEELFYAKPISTTTGKLASTELSGLPVKKARITGIKEKYCNDAARDATTYTYTDENGEEVTVADTNYGITYNGTPISDTLVIPYKVKIGDEYYTVTEVDLMAKGSGPFCQYPRVRCIIYPETVDTIKFESSSDGSPVIYNPEEETYIKDVVFPKSLRTLEANSLNFLTKNHETNVWITKDVTSITSDAYSSWCIGPNIKFEGTEAEWNTLTSGLNKKDKLTVEFNCSMPTTIPQ